ncbi:MAG: lauroyl/myristoyl acyltransferase [Myxococcota bacterium]
MEDAASTPGLRERLKDFQGSPKDIARWLFWVKLRGLLDPAHPERVQALYPLWRAQYRLAQGQRALMAEEYRSWLGHADESLLQEAYRIAFRVHLEEVLLGGLTVDNCEQYMVFDGRENLDAALARGKGAILLNPHAGNFMLMIAAVSLAGYPYTQYAARGMAPPEVAAENPDVFGINRWRREARAAREASEDRLPANFITLDTSVRHLYRCLARNECIGIAFDGRIGSRFVRVPYLGRQALLNPGPYRMAASTGAAIVPTLCSTPADGPNVCTFGEPIFGDDPGELLRRFIEDAVEPWLTKNPATYGVWLAHCRERRAVDDHPFFIDYAPDDRWKKHDRPL